MERQTATHKDDGLRPLRPTAVLYIVLAAGGSVMLHPPPGTERLRGSRPEPEPEFSRANLVLHVFTQHLKKKVNRAGGLQSSGLHSTVSQSAQLSGSLPGVAGLAGAAAAVRVAGCYTCNPYFNYAKNSSTGSSPGHSQTLSCSPNLPRAPPPLNQQAAC